MAQQIWLGGTGVWDTDGNWNTVHPAIGDTAVFDGSTNVSVTTPPGTTDEDISIQIDRTYTGDLGASGNEIVLRVNKMVHEGQGSVWLNSDAGTAEFSDMVIVNSSNSTNAATLGGDEIARIIVRSGNVTISGALVHDFELYVCGPNANVTVAAGAGGTAATAGAASELFLRQTAGIVTSSVAWDRVIVAGGTFTHDTTALTTLDCYGGICNLNARLSGAEISGDVTVGGSGVVDLTKNTGGAFTITGDLQVTQGGTIRYFDGHLTVSGNQGVAGGTLAVL